MTRRTESVPRLQGRVLQLQACIALFTFVVLLPSDWSNRRCFERFDMACALLAMLPSEVGSFFQKEKKLDPATGVLDWTCAGSRALPPIFNCRRI